MSPMTTLVLRDLDPRHLVRPYEKVLEQLRSGDFRSAEVKRLRGGGIYRAKLDDKNRLLFDIASRDGQTYLLILEVVHNHDYAKARFLNGGSYTDADFEPAGAPSAPASVAERMTYVNPRSPLLHVLDKPLSFDDAQTSVFETPLPLIVIGSAGSGKTALVLEKLKTIPGRGLYLTRSSYLVENARSLYFARGYSNDGQDVDFLSLRELVETIDVPPGREATYLDFASWYGRMRGAFKLAEPHRIYEEIKGVITGAPAAGPWMSESEYVELGVRQSIFLGDQRPTVYQIFQRWLVHLAESRLHDASVAAWERRERAEEVYDFLVIDEVQDITIVELTLALATLREKRQFLLCGDANQIVHPNLFSWARVKSLFWAARDREASPLDQIHVLEANYRNTRAVTAVANRLLLVKQRRFGSIDRESNYLIECASGEDGRVDLVRDGAPARAEIEAKTRRSTRYAIVVLRDEDKDGARQAFSTPLVFSVQEAKGLEYENVILFNVVSAAAREFHECTAGVAPEDLEGGLGYARARDKTDKSLDAYKFYVNALYVAMTRAVRSLLVVERDPDHPLWKLLEVDRVNERVELARDESSREDWQREARRLELQGKTEQAEQIRREILEIGPVPWAVLDASTFDEVRALALGDASPSSPSREPQLGLALEHSRRTGSSAPSRPLGGPQPSLDKEAQQRLFEFALTCDAPGLLPQLEAVGFRHARKPESGRAFIEATHYADYRLKRPQALWARIAKHGIDFRNPLDETPLMVAAKIGNAELVRELLAQGADSELTDSCGRTALRVLLAAWLERRDPKRSFADVHRQLATAPIKVKLGSRMTKLDPRSMEWFLLHLSLVLYRSMLPEALERGHGLPAFKATTFERVLASFPSDVLPDHRKKRAYVSSILAKNEVFGTNPYNRRLFYRALHGHYVLNPALEIEVRGDWMGVDELMGLPLLRKTVVRRAMLDEHDRWAELACRQVKRWLHATGGDGAPPPSGTRREPAPPSEDAGGSAHGREGAR